MAMKIGSHVGNKAPEYLLGSVKEMISYKANAMMVYTGAPQNTKRVEVEKLMISEATQLLLENDLSWDNVIVHAPYIINLGNVHSDSIYQLGIDFLKKEMGFDEMSIGVDKDNITAIHLYKKFGFTQVLYEGKDDQGEYYKLMKTIR